MDLRQIRYMIAVSEELNFTRAAERCNVSQPPLTRAIRELEKQVGARLFDRSTHHVALTPAGEGLVADARKALAMLEEGVDRARRTALGLTGTLTFGFGGSTVYSLLPTLVRRFTDSTPDVSIRFHALPVLHQIEALREGLIDIGIVRLPIHDELIDTLFVHSEPLAVALPTGHPLLRDSRPVHIGDLQSSRFVTYEPTRGFNFHADLYALCRLAGFTPDVAHEAPTTEAVVGIVACGEGVAIIPSSAERLRMRGVAFRPLVTAHKQRQLGQVSFALAWRKGQTSATVQKFLEIARTPASSLAND